jgi:hypothetical protein
MPKLSALFSTPCHAPTVDAGIQAALLSMFPKSFLTWDHRAERWQIWIELRDVSHPGAKNKRMDTDKWNTDHQLWMRKLQNYTHADGSFAPADERLIMGLEMADTWSNKRFYEDHVEEPEAKFEASKAADHRDMFGQAARYYHSIPNPIVGRHVNSGWRRGTL